MNIFRCSYIPFFVAWPKIVSRLFRFHIIYYICISCLLMYIVLCRAFSFTVTINNSLAQHFAHSFSIRFLATSLNFAQRIFSYTISICMFRWCYSIVNWRLHIGIGEWKNEVEKHWLIYMHNTDTQTHLQTHFISCAHSFDVCNSDDAIIMYRKRVRKSNWRIFSVRFETNWDFSKLNVYKCLKINIRNWRFKADDAQIVRQFSIL